MTTFLRTLVVLTISATMSHAQPFEGKITYQNAFKCKIPNLTDEMFTMMMGSSQEYIIKGGNYRTVSNGTLLQWQLYLNTDNKLYTKFSNSPSVLWNDGAVNSDEVLKSEWNKNVVEILGYPCDELILTCKSGVQKFYFNSKLKIDAALFQHHKFGNWSEYVSKANALPLKIMIDNAQFTLESVATVVDAQKIDDGIFQLPPDTKLEKSPF